MWGVDISKPSEAADVILLKFLRAAADGSSGPNAAAGAARLEKTLEFRKQRGVENFKLGDLTDEFQGHDTIAGTDSDGRPVLVSRYGGMDNDRVFGNSEAFVAYRMHIMEEVVRKLSFKKGDAETLCQVHDYSGVPLLFKTNEVKNCVNAMSKTFGEHYPETKGTTIFVNFPATFSKLFQAFSLFLPERTRNKFVILGESDQALLFERLRPEAVPEDLGGMLRRSSGKGAAPALAAAPCSLVSVGARATEEVKMAKARGASKLLWELRVCHGEVNYDVVFVPSGRAGAGSAEEVIVVSSGGSPLKAKDGIVSGDFQAPGVGALICRFKNDRAWLQSRLCIARGAAL